MNNRIHIMQICTEKHCNHERILKDLKYNREPALVLISYMKMVLIGK